MWIDFPEVEISLVACPAGESAYNPSAFPEKRLTAPVAQLDRVVVFETIGSTFESWRARQNTPSFRLLGKGFFVG